MDRQETVAGGIGGPSAGAAGSSRALAPFWRLARSLPRSRSLAAYFLLALLVVHLALLGIALASAETVHQHTGDLEVRLALALHERSLPALTALFLALTYLGSGPGNAILTSAFVWLLVHRRWTALGAAVLFVMLGAWWLEAVTKLLVQRTRPELFRLASATGYSFPSGHALLATCLYASMAYALSRRARRTSHRVGLAALAVAMAFGIGSSRVYLGVHFPTDVLGGWAAGLMWLAAAWVALRLWVARRLRSGGRRGVGRALR